MTQINGLTGTVTAIGGSSGAWTATVNINSSGFSAYTGGGTAVGLPYNLGLISAISSGSVTTVTFSSGTGNNVNPFQYGEVVAFSGVNGMTQINGLSGTVQSVGGTTGAWTITVNVNSSSFSAYTSGGQAVASDAYTSLATYYQSGNAGNGTYGLVVENVCIYCFVVGVAIGLSGNSSLAADLTFRNVNIAYCDVSYAIGQGQSRNLNIEYGNITYARTGIDGLNYGAQFGTPPQLLRVNLGFLYRVFAMSQSDGNFMLQDCYAESIQCLGEYGLGEASSAIPLTFLGGDYVFGGSGWTQPPFVLETYGPTAFRGTGFAYVVEIDAWNFIMPTAPLLFDHCTFTGTSVANYPAHVAVTIDAAGSGGYAKFLDCWMNGATFGGNAFLISNDLGRSSSVSTFTNSAARLNAIYQTHRVSNGGFSNTNPEYVFLPFSNTPPITIFGVSSLALNAAQLAVGDILFWQMVPQGYSLIKWSVPALKITSISSTITCSLLFDQHQYDTVANQPSQTQVAVAPYHWAPTQALKCNTSNGSTTLSSVAPMTILQNGDFVVGSSNIPANTRVVSGGGTATVTISQAATGTASGVELYFGRLYFPTLTPIT
jgi:hypothetical protein